MTTPCSFEEQPKKAIITATTRPVAAVTVAIIDLFISRVSIGLPRYLLPYARSSISAAAVSLGPNTDGPAFIKVSSVPSSTNLSSNHPQRVSGVGGDFYVDVFERGATAFDGVGNRDVG